MSSAVPVNTGSRGTDRRYTGTRVPTPKESEIADPTGKDGIELEDNAQKQTLDEHS